MARDRELEEAIYEHLQELAYAKKALLHAATDIANDYPTQASVLLRAMKALTKSANKLLGDTKVD